MLGVLGGMGPMATVDFMAKIAHNTEAARDQDHVEMVACSAAGIPDRTEAILGRGPDPLPAMRAALVRLEAAGATFIAFPCNTAHHWHGALQRHASARILHIVDAVVERLGTATGDVGVLATDGTLKARIYQDRLGRHGINCRAPDAAGQAEVMRAIRLVKAGRSAEAAAILTEQAEALIAAGCARVAMACTEIPVALAGAEGDLGSRLLDATDALAAACVRVSGQSRLLPIAA